MSSRIQPQLCYRFGPFELDSSTGVLRKHGIRLKLEEKPQLLLEALLQRPGEVVSREDLRKALWSDQTFIEFDSGLNSAVRKLRRALSEDPKKARYIETFPKKGYRFIHELEVRAVEPQAPPVSPVSQRSARKIAGRGLDWRLAATGLVAAAVLAWALLRSPEPRPSSFDPTPLTSFAGSETDPTFSPDGSHVAFIWSKGQAESDIYAMAVGAAEPLRLTTSPQSRERSPAWSPDGSTIAFLRGRAVFAVAPTGGAERNLFEAEGYLNSAQLAWTSDSRALLVSAALDEAPQSIHLISLDSGDVKRLTFPETDSDCAAGYRRCNDFIAEMSPDGRRLAWSRELSSEQTQILTGAPDASGSELIAVVPGVVWSFDWMSDSNSLIVQSRTAPGNEDYIRKVSVADGKVELIEGGKRAALGALAMSDSGNRLAYEKGRNSSTLWRYDLTGQSPPRALFGSTLDEHAPVFSPDGRRIAFVWSQTGEREIWTSDLNGDNLVRATQTGADFVGTPVWSSDGRTIAFNRRETGPGHQFDVYAVDSGGGAAWPLADGPTDEQVVGWSADGGSVYLLLRTEQPVRRQQLYRVAVSGGEPEIHLPEHIHTISAGQPYLDPVRETIAFPQRSEGGVTLESVTLSEGGEVIPAPEIEADAFGWAVAQGAVYYLRRGDDKLRRIDPATGAVEETLTIPGVSANEPRPCSVSPDETTVICTVWEDRTDLFLVDGMN